MVPFKYWKSWSEADEYRGPTMYLCNHICGVMDWRLDRSAQCLLVGKR